MKFLFEIVIRTFIIVEMRYIALLRGINVGGKNKVGMPELKAVFERAGFSNVVTYINSGNILFNTDLAEDVVKTICEKAIKERFSLDIPVCIISVPELKEVLTNIPNWWDENAQSKHNAIFAIPPMTAKEICLEIGEIKPEYEKISVCGKVVFWSAPIATFSRTRLTKIVDSKKAYNQITIRNANTTKKLVNL